MGSFDFIEFESFNGLVALAAANLSHQRLQWIINYQKYFYLGNLQTHGNLKKNSSLITSANLVLEIVLQVLRIERVQANLWKAKAMVSYRSHLVLPIYQSKQSKD